MRRESTRRISTTCAQLGDDLRRLRLDQRAQLHWIDL